MLAPRRPAEAGSPAIRASLENLLKQYAVCESRNVEEIEVNGEWAFTRGTYRSVRFRRTDSRSLKRWANTSKS